MIDLRLVVFCLVWTVSFSHSLPGSLLMSVNVWPERKVLLQWKDQMSWQENHDVEMLADLMGRVDEHLRSTAMQQNEVGNATDCVVSLMNFGFDAVHKKPYAMQAVDAFGKPESGMFLGNIKWSGKYYECQKVKSKYFNGKWCALTVGQQDTAFGTSVGLILGLCVPDTCSEKYLNDTIHSLLGNSSASVKCPVQPTKWTAGDILSMLVVCVLLFLLVLGTAVDWCLECKLEREKNRLSINGDGLPVDSNMLKPQNRSLWTETAGCFSIIRNTKALLSTESKSSTIDALHGIRFISITWVILGHTYVMTLAYIDNLKDTADWYFQAFSFQAIANATYSVDTFFFLSGLLVTYLALKESNRFSGRKIPLMYLQRYLRLTPAYAFLILFTVGFYGKLGDGPYWPESVAASRDICVKYWWTNMLYINNFYPNNNGVVGECFALGWYLANDMQFFLLAPLSIILLKWRPKLGLYLLIFGLFSCVLVTGIISAHYQLQPQVVGLAMLINLILGTTPGGNPSQNGTNHNLGMPPMSPEDAFWSDTYTKPWCRIGVYIIGMMTGYILHATKLKIKMSKIFATCGWALATALNFSIVYGLWSYVQDAKPLVVSLAAFYNAMCRPIWAVGLAWVVIACATGYGGPVNRFLSWKAFVPLSRLTFCIYLVHPMIIYWWFASLEVSAHYSNVQFAFFFMATVTSAVAVAYVISMLVEAPFTNLTKMMLKPRAPEPSRQEDDEPLISSENSDD